MTLKPKPRKGYLAALASLVVPPMGHVYAGRPIRGLTVLGMVLLCAVILGWAGASRSLLMYYFAQVFFIGAMLALAFDAYRIAATQKEYLPRWYNRWYVFLPLLAAASLIYGLISENRLQIFGFQPYRIPSPAMDPALQRGDMIVVDGRKYREFQVPNRGTIIVFEFPEDRATHFVKRVVGLPGETVEIFDGDIYIDGELEEEPYIYRKNAQRDFSLYFDEITIPQDSVFVLGDWRDNSRDSRFWGPLPLDHIRGEVGLIWYAYDLDRIGAVAAP